MVDARANSTFWVYPPAASGASVELIYQSTPSDFAASGPDAVTGTLTEQESLYGGAMVDYVAYRAFSKDSEYAGNANRAVVHYQQFANAIGVGRKNDLVNSANFANVGGVPDKAIAAQ
jgi:hypothetical protein